MGVCSRPADLPSWICHPWQFRALTANSTNLSIVETCIIAAGLTGDRGFIEDEAVEPFFGAVTKFIFYFWQAPFASLAAGGAVSGGTGWQAQEAGR